MDISMRADIKRKTKITYSSAVSKYLDFCQGLECSTSSAI